ncbi:hypothetical protein AV530_016320 [Patagioenas fasciata monilis]|uniref:Junctional sarcoplasmic reticulum protein 1 n=1 Tax=Patagioenas fasciata monilis TaxID=372326 RepID=A0A1V4KWB9_PATFA|nr:hypothetical protein AV530_016320 [Patagioenas fasciata monilis]
MGSRAMGTLVLQGEVSPKQDYSKMLRQLLLYIIPERWSQPGGWRRDGGGRAPVTAPPSDMAAGPPEVLERDLGCPAATNALPGWAGKGRSKADADGPVSSVVESGGAHDLDELELSMPEPAPLGADKKAAEKKRVEKVGAKGGAAGPPVPRSLPVQRKVEPPGLDPAEEPLLWEGLTLNKCILVASVVALLSVTFQVLQAPCSREGVSPGRQDPPPPPLHEVVSAEEEEVQEVVTAQPAQPESSMFKDDDGDGDDDDGDDDDEADSNLAEPWIFKKWFGRSTPEDEDEEPVDVPEVPLAVTEVKKSQEKKPEKTEKEEKLEKLEEEKAQEKPEKEEKEDTPEEEEKEEKPEKEKKPREKKKKKEEKARERRSAQEWSGRREARAKDRALGDRPGRALRAPREPEQPPQKQRGREGRERRRERDEPRREGWKGRPGRAEGGRESPTRDWRQHKGRRRD